MRPHEQFARNIREKRIERRISQEALASAAKLHRSEVSLLERGARDPRLSTIVRIARALRCTPSALLEEID